MTRPLETVDPKTGNITIRTRSLDLLERLYHTKYNGCQVVSPVKSVFDWKTLNTYATAVINPNKADDHMSFVKGMSEVMKEAPKVIRDMIQYIEAGKRKQIENNPNVLNPKPVYKMKTFTCSICSTKTTCSAEDVEYTIHNEGWHWDSEGKEYCHSCGKVEWASSDNFPPANIAAMKQFLDIENTVFDVFMPSFVDDVWSISIDRLFDTKEEAEYFISLLKAFCK